MIELNIIQPYDKIYTTKKKTIIMYSPRISGKTKAIIQALFIYSTKYPRHDIVVARANYNSLKDSLFAEIIALQDELGINGFFKAKVSPLRIDTITGTRIYFTGIGGADDSRTRGLKTSKKISLVIFDETQQLKDELNLKHAMATFIRALDDNIDSKMIIAGNPEQPKAHWWNEFCRKHRTFGRYEFIDATYLDIIRYLPKTAVEEIEIEREMNPAMYKFMYLGNIDDLAGGAYAQFKREKHYIEENKLTEMFRTETIEYIIFGGDGAITHDSTTIIPIAIMSSGRAVVLERFFFDPLENGVVLSSVQLVDLILIYYQELDNKYHFYDNNVGIVWAIDTASKDLIVQLTYELPEWHLVRAFTKKSIIRNNSVVNNAFSRNMVYIKNFGGQKNYYSNKWENKDPLITQLESVVWKNYKLDPEIPNDCTDALTYGLNYYFLNPDNLRLPEIQKVYK